VCSSDLVEGEEEGIRERRRWSEEPDHQQQPVCRIYKGSSEDDRANTKR